LIDLHPYPKVPAKSCKLTIKISVLATTIRKNRIRFKLERYMNYPKNGGRMANQNEGTIFQASNAPLTVWYLAIYITTGHKKGISSHQLAKDLKVT